MPKDINENQICAYFMHHGTIEGESGVTTTQAESKAASDTFRDKQIKEQPLNADGNLRAPPTRVGKEAAVMTDEKDAHSEDVPELFEALGVAFDHKPHQGLRVDMAKYQAYFDDEDLSEEQKAQIVEALWMIIVCFVDLGYGISPLQLACGQLAESEDQSGNPDSGVLECEATTLSDTFNRNAAE